jgi:glycosyltransferase involved in cell wall biosynthesis
MPEAQTRVLFLQATEAGGYPPILHASSLFASVGAKVVILNAPVAGYDLTVPFVAGVNVRNIARRPSHMMSKFSYLRYVCAAAQLAATFRPTVVYASDPMGAGPGLLAARLANATLVYHEHDTPKPGTLHPRIAHFRKAAAQKAPFVIFPNTERARLAQAELGFRDDQLRIVWNVPRRSELPELSAPHSPQATVLYHGSLTPERLPESVIAAIAECGMRLRLIGYEVQGAKGYLARLLEVGRRFGENVVEYLGQFSRDRLLAETARADVGLALLPLNPDDMNLKYMLGASNKVFDYMASGLAVLVPELPDWIGCFVDPGYGRSCNPADSRSLAAQLQWFAANPDRRRDMGTKARMKIEADWNYEKAFAPVLDHFVHA